MYFNLFNRDVTRILGLLIIAILLIDVPGCANLITDPGPQPTEIEKTGYQPKLNILGVLRPDNITGKPMSYVHLEHSHPISEWEDSFIIPDARVKLYVYQGQSIIDSMLMVYSDQNSLYTQSEYRIKDFYPIAGKTYKISCVKDNFFKLTGITTIPLIPIVMGDINIKNNTIAFNIVRDELAALYDIYLYMNGKVFSDRFQRPENGNISITLTYERSNEEHGELVIYAYDINLSEYITYNISIKPNTYRSDYSTVDNGFGCFGSLNIYKTTIQFDIK